MNFFANKRFPLKKKVMHVGYKNLRLFDAAWTHERHVFFVFFWFHKGLNETPQRKLGNQNWGFKNSKTTTNLGEMVNYLEGNLRLASKAPFFL